MWLLWVSVFLLCFLFYFESMPFCVSSGFSVSPVCFSLHYLTCPLSSSLSSPVPHLVISVSCIYSFPMSQFRVYILQRPHLKANYVTTLREGCPSSRAPPNAPRKCGLLLPLFGGCTATILRGLTYPKILCAPKKEERKRKNGNVACRSSSFSWPGRKKS